MRHSIWIQGTPEHTLLEWTMRKLRSRFPRYKIMAITPRFKQPAYVWELYVTGYRDSHGLHAGFRDVPGIEYLSAIIRNTCGQAQLWRPLPKGPAWARVRVADRRLSARRRRL